MCLLQGLLDPFLLVKEEIESVSERLRRSIFTGIPTLRSAAQYFFKVRASCVTSVSFTHRMAVHVCSCRQVVA